MKEITVLDENNIRNKIYTVRGLQVMLDKDLAGLYNVKTKVFNQAVRRNLIRFPKNFMFQLTGEEYDSLRSQIVTLEKGRGKYRKYLPYAFTEQGVAMLSGVLRSKVAIQISIDIINAFVSMRKFIASNAQIFQRLGSVEKKQLAYEIKTDKRFEQIFTAIESKDIKPKKGIFFNGQIFDSYNFVSDIVRSARKFHKFVYSIKSIKLIV